MRQSEKQRLNLARRQKDYETMIAKPSVDNWKGYKRPGSIKKRK